MTQLNLDEAREWLEILYGDTPGLIHICSTADWTGRTFGAETDPIDLALAYIQALDSRKVEGIYLRAATLRSTPVQGHRGGDELSFYLPGLWADIDIAGPGHKSKETLPPTVEEAMKIVSAAGLPDPSHWIHSGGGLYPWWLLQSPIEIVDLEDFRSLSQGWQNALAAGAQKLGYHYGSGIGDLSRVLRVPGTVNRKAGLERPCTMLEGYSWNGPLYDEAALFDALTAVTPEPPRPTPIQVKMSQSSRDGERPGDEFNRTADWHDILIPQGWQWIRRNGDTWYLRRPGKLSGGHSATIRVSTDRLWVFSEEASPFQPFKLYDKFSAYATLEHNGDFAAAARELGARGYGQRNSMGMEMVQPSVPDAKGLVPLRMPQASDGNGEMEKTTSSTTPITAVLVPKQRDSLGLPIHTSASMVGMSWDGIGMARRWVEMHQDIFRYIGSDKKWMQWDGKRWAPDDRLRHEFAVSQLVASMIENAVTQEQKKLAHRMSFNPSIAGLIRNVRLRPEIAASHDDFDAQANLLTVDNGVLDLDTMQLLPHSPELMLTKKMNTSYVPSAPAGRWQQFICEVLPDDEVRGYVQRVCGYMLTGATDERVMMLLYGESGTGKTQFLEAIGQVMGDFAGVAPASAFQPRPSGYKGPSEDLHKLRGKRFVMQSELDAGSRLNEPLVKSIVGSDMQTTRPLYGAPVDWHPQYTAFLATNHLPRISSAENAIWNRVKPIHFGKVFINDQGQALHPGDRNLGKKMATSEPEAILNWLLEGLAEYRRIGLAEPEQVTMWTKQYREDVDSARQFVNHAPDDGMIVLASDQRVTVTELYRKYVEWCQHNGITPLGMRNFNARMESAGYTRKRRDRGIMWDGIGLGSGWLISGSMFGQGAYSRRE